MSARPIPDGHHAVTPHLTVKDAARAIEFYRQAFGARELVRMPGPDGRGVIHAEIQIGDSIVFLSDEMPGASCRSPESLGGTTASLYLYVEGVDAVFQRAVGAGARVLMPVADMFWGDRFGKVADPFGHEWGLATHVEDLTPAEVGRRARAALARMTRPAP